MRLNLQRFSVAALLVGGLFCGACERETATASRSPQARRQKTPDENPAVPAAADNGASVITAASVQPPINAGAPGGEVRGGAIPAVEPIHQTVAATTDGKVPLVVWDLSDERNPDKVGWPKDQGNNKVFSVDGDFEFQLKVQDKENFSGRVRQVESRRSGGLIEGIEITSQAQPTEDAYQRAKKMLADMHFSAGDKQQLEAWHEKAKAGNYDNLELRRTNSYNRVFILHVINDGTSEEPWSVDLDVDWSQVCGCHG